MRIKEKNAIALVMSDVHLSLKPPLCRSLEPDWLEAQERVLEQVRQLESTYKCPVLIAGDLFDRPDNPAELVNWAIEHLPRKVYAVPGQHDLPLHRYADIRKSSFGTLACAERINTLHPDSTVELKHAPGVSIFLHGFPWGYPIKSKEKQEGIHIAVVHQSVWNFVSMWPGAPEDCHMNRFLLSCKGYNLVTIGDNHIPFSDLADEPMIYNCGTLQRRKSDEKDHSPSVGLIIYDGKKLSIERKYLDCSKDRFTDTKKEDAKQPLDLSSFMDELQSLGNSAIDFSEAVKRYLYDNNTKQSVKDLVLGLLERGMK